MGERWARARARAPSKTSWAWARALPYQREILTENAPQKNDMSFSRNCMCFYTFLYNISR